MIVADVQILLGAFSHNIRYRICLTMAECVFTDHYFIIIDFFQKERSYRSKQSKRSFLSMGILLYIITRFRTPHPESADAVRRTDRFRGLSHG